MKIKSKKWIERNNLKNWKLAVKTRDKYYCQVCKKKVIGINCQAHHILPKQFKGLKFDVMNGITLCFRHHKVDKYSPHQHALWFYEWLKNEKPEQFKYLKTI